MSDNGYDIAINEVAKILDKSDRQVRRYVKERRLKAKPVRVDGHMKLMFSREEVEAFKDKFMADGVFGDSGREIVVDAQLVDTDVTDVADVTSDDEPAAAETADSEDSMAVKYVIDAMKEQISLLRDENKDLHYQLEQRSGQVGFLQGKIEMLQEEIKMLAPAPKEETPEHIPWYRRWFGRN